MRINFNKELFPGKKGGGNELKITIHTNWKPFLFIITGVIVLDIMLIIPWIKELF